MSRRVFCDRCRIEIKEDGPWRLLMMQIPHNTAPSTEAELCARCDAELKKFLSGAAVVGFELVDDEPL